MYDKIMASLFTAYILGILFTVLLVLSIAWWWWILFAVFAGIALLMIAITLGREAEDD